ncbi:hypothetical protein ACOBQX_08205 [Actinokineospora sp. G85]|uniref:hypothetical protein n=1 Tax=Actinokineospora sp. G85 TaxID=3406626 RepID=UPI003C77C7D6
MRKIRTSVGALAAACLLTVGLATSAGAATGTLYVVQDGQVRTYTDPARGLCVSSDPAKGEVTFINRTNGVAWTFYQPGCNSVDQIDYLRVGQRLTLRPGASIRMLQ